MEQGPPHRRLSEPEDASELQPHHRMGDLAERPKRQPVAHDILDNCLIAHFVEAVGVLPEPVWATHLFIHEPGRWLPS